MQQTNSFFSSKNQQPPASDELEQTNKFTDRGAPNAQNAQNQSTQEIILDIKNSSNSR